MCMRHKMPIIFSPVKNYNMITKETFLLACSHHPANKIVKFVCRYFSPETPKEDRWLAHTLIGVTIATGFIGIFMGFVSPLIGFGIKIAEIIAMIFTILIFILVFITFISHILENSRTKKIAKELGISTDKYNEYTEMYL